MKRKILRLTLIAMIFETIHLIEMKQISCELITIYDYVHKVTFKDCHMDKTTSIDSPNIKMFTRDNSMERLLFENNKKVLYLPDMIGDAYPNLIILVAANCSIKEITSTNLRNLAELKELYLQNNQIEKIASGAFKSLNKIRNLPLHGNRIKSIANGAFEGLKELKNLQLSDILIEKVVHKAFSGLIKLEELHLQHLQIKEVSNGAFIGLINLKKLYLHFNQIEKVTSGMFEGMPELEELHLYQNQIKEIPNGAFKSLKKLKKLYLFSNQIETIRSNSFQDLVMLEILGLDYNKIKFLNGKAFRSFKKTLINLSFNYCINETITTNHGPQALIKITKKCGYVEPKLKKVKLSKMSTQTFVTIVMLAVCAVLVWILVGLVLYRKCFHQRSLKLQQSKQKAIILANLTISETIITEVKSTLVDDNDSLDSSELITSLT